MLRKRTWLGLVTIAALSVGCSSEATDPEAVGTVIQAIGPCNETVPSNRFIDGLPAYAQCAATQNSAIYSNDGINTATTSMGADWVRTQYSGGYQCTELAHRYLLFRWNVKWLPNGNAGQWCDTQPPATSGVVQTTNPVHGDLIVLAPGSCGADGVTGHVAVVDTVAAKISAVQQNSASRSSYATTCAKCYIHVVANDGSAMPGTGGAAGAGGSTAAGGFASKRVILMSSAKTRSAQASSFESWSGGALAPMQPDMVPARIPSIRASTSSSLVRSAAERCATGSQNGVAGIGRGTHPFDTQACCSVQPPGSRTPSRAAR